MLDARRPTARSRCVEPTPSLMLSPSGSAAMAVTCAPGAAVDLGRDAPRPRRARSRRRRAGRPGARARRRAGGRRSARRRRRRCAPGRSAPRSGAGRGPCCDRRLDLGLDVVGQLVPAGGEQLDAVVGHRVVRRREHHAEVGAVGRRSGRRPPGWAARPTRSTSAPGGGQPGDHGGLEHLAAGPRVAARRPRRGRCDASCADEHAGRRTGDGQRQLRGEVAVGQPPDAVGAEAARPTDGGQRLEYWGALRAFFRPYFLRSLTRGSRVRKPAFFSAGRSSGSISISARAMPRRSAPAWPVMPPP